MLLHVSFSKQSCLIMSVCCCLLIRSISINSELELACIKYLVDFEELEEREDKMDVQEGDHL